MKSNLFKAVCLTHCGKRDNNEDNYLFGNKYNTSQTMENAMLETMLTSSGGVHFYAVADGMGGHNAGEIASRICVTMLADAEKQAQTKTSLSGVVQLAQSTISSINSKLCAMGSCKNEFKGMGTTLVLLVDYNNKFAVLNIGDSRAYHFDGNMLTQITTDHTEGQRMLDLGLLTRKELANFPAKKFLSRYIGYETKEIVFKADENYPILNSGVVLLCSDGITDFLSDGQIADVLALNMDIDIAGKMLIKQAIEQPNSDNATVILIKIGA